MLSGIVFGCLCISNSLANGSVVVSSGSGKSFSCIVTGIGFIKCSLGSCESGILGGVCSVVTCIIESILGIGKSITCSWDKTFESGLGCVECLLVYDCTVIFSRCIVFSCQSFTSFNIGCGFNVFESRNIFLSISKIILSLSLFKSSLCWSFVSLSCGFMCRNIRLSCTHLSEFSRRVITSRASCSFSILGSCSSCFRCSNSIVQGLYLVDDVLCISLVAFSIVLGSFCIRNESRCWR